MSLAQLTAAVDASVAVDPRTVSDGEGIVEPHRQLARLEAVTTRAAAAFDADREWASDRARSAGSWLAYRCHLPAEAAKRRIRLGRALRHLPGAEAAWLAGDICDYHVNLLDRARNPVTEEQLAADEDHLVRIATNMTFAYFARAMAYWRLRADPDGAERSDREKYDSRRFHYSQSWADMYFGDLLLDPISGAILARRLQAIYDELFAADWDEAKARLGREPTVSDLTRTPAQRRADALVEMATRAGAMPHDARRPEPLFTVLVGYETFSDMMLQLADGTVVSPSSLFRWLDSAWVERVVFDSPSRVIDVGVTRRLFGGATRRAVEVRDRECFHPYCDWPAEACQIDHIVPYSAGGATAQHNGRVACGKHNRARHQRRTDRGP